MSIKQQIKKCPYCGCNLDKIVYEGYMHEEWAFNGDNWECSGRNSLTDDPGKEVICGECNRIVGTGNDFGFGRS